MSRPWRNCLVAGLPLLVACLATLTAPAVAATPPRVSCGASLDAVDVYFWPNGHPAIASLHFPRYSPTHVEVYRGGSVARSAQLAYLDAKGWSVTRACTAAPMSGVTFAPGGRKSVAAASKITCRLPAQAQLVSLPASNGNNLWIVLGQGKTAILWLTLKSGASQASWLRAYCSAKRVPGVE